MRRLYAFHALYEVVLTVKARENVAVNRYIMDLAVWLIIRLYCY